MKKDLIGKAILDFYTQKKPKNLITETNISETDEMDVSYFFRDFNKMPKIEQKALELAKGKILDIGCGAGSHALYLQNQKKHQVTAIDISPAAIKTCKLRGIKDARVQDFMTLDKEKFDTVLLLMNGTGICGNLKNTKQFFSKLKTLLNDGGQILIDSSDIIYMFDQNSNGAREIPFQDKYYGELQFTISYKEIKEETFDWLFLDYKTLKNIALQNELKCELILEGDNYDYLARLYFDH